MEWMGVGKGSRKVVAGGGAEREEKVCIIDAVQYNTTIQIYGLMQLGCRIQGVMFGSDFDGR